MPGQLSDFRNLVAQALAIGTRQHLLKNVGAIKQWAEGLTNEEYQAFLAELRPPVQPVQQVQVDGPPEPPEPPPAPPALVLGGGPPAALSDAALADVLVDARAEALKIDIPLKFAYPKDSYDKYSFPYWFNYFYVELPRARQEEFYRRILSGKVLKPLGNIGTPEKQALLQEMYKIGFFPFPTSRKAQLAVVAQFIAQGRKGVVAKGYLPDWAPRLKQSQADFVAGLRANRDPQPDGYTCKVVFRGDGRPPSLIQAHGGTTPMSRVDSLRQTSGMTQPWHPFQTVSGKNGVHFRLSNADNCLFTVISVSQDPLVASKFPLLEELLEDPAERAKLGTATVTLKGGNRVQLKASRTNLYVINPRDGGWDTQHVQQSLGSGTFPERAMERISWAHHLIHLDLIRVHHGDEANVGHQVIIKDLTVLQELTAVGKTRTLEGHDPASTVNLIKAMWSLVTKCRVDAHGKVGYTYVPEGNPVTKEIAQIEEIQFPNQPKLVPPLPDFVWKDVWNQKWETRAQRRQREQAEFERLRAAVRMHYG